jgi:hypothetical protein
MIDPSMYSVWFNDVGFFGTWIEEWFTAPQVLELRSWLQRLNIFRRIFYLLLLCFLITFFFPWTLTPHHERIVLYTMTLNEHSVTLSFSPSRPSFVYHGLHLHFASLLIFFLADRMRWQRILALWHQDWHVVKLGIERKGLLKNGKILAIF